MKIYFTADTHFWHTNIIRFCNRPFASVEEMNQALIENWNEQIAPEDEVYHLGDVSLGSPARTVEVLKQLNGKLYLIKGNHESAVVDNASCRAYFKWVKDYHELKVSDADAPGGSWRIVLLHYAMRVWNKSHHGSWHLYGHSHGSLPDDPNARSMDVGVDCHGFRPVSFDDVKARLLAKHFQPVDHHR